MADTKLTVVLGILVLLFAVSLVMEYTKRSEPDNTEIITIGKDELYCNGDSDCTLAQTRCCSGCGYGTAMNLRTAEKIGMARADKCKGVDCPIYDCDSNSCIEQGKTEPRASCVNNTCIKVSVLIDCGKVCNSMSMIREEILQLGCNPSKTSFESLYGVCRCGF